MTTAHLPAGPLSTEQLFHLHGRFLRRFLQRLCVHADQLEDVLQDVFLTVHLHGGYRPGSAKPESYLARVALLTARSYRRRARRERARHCELSSDQVACSGPDLSCASEVRQELQRVGRALARLPQALQVLVLRVDVDGASCVDVAQELGLPLGTVYSRLHLARKRLHSKLELERRGRASPRSSGLRVSCVGDVAA